jgi:hemerythrin superfamily protein
MGTAIGPEKTLDALDLLAAHHDAIDSLLELVENEPVIERKQFAFDELADLITAHAAVEEQLFYPAVRANAAQDILLETNHVAIERTLVELLATDVDDDDFDARLAVLRAEIEHHAREDEEQILFPKLRRVMTAEQLHALGIEMQDLFERILAAGVRRPPPLPGRAPRQTAA